MSEQESQKIEVSKFTLSTGKVIYLREPLIGDTEKATQVAGKIAGPENEAYLSVLFQKEMIKLLLVQVDGNKLELNDKQQLDKLFKFREYSQVARAVKAVLGDGDSEGNFELTPEHTSL